MRILDYILNLTFKILFKPLCLLTGLTFYKESVLIVTYSKSGNTHTHTRLNKNLFFLFWFTTHVISTSSRFKLKDFIIDLKIKFVPKMFKSIPRQNTIEIFVI